MRLEGRRVTCGDIALYIYRDGDGVQVRLGWHSESLTFEQIQELNADLQRAIKELFPEREL